MLHWGKQGCRGEVGGEVATVILELADGSQVNPRVSGHMNS